MQHDGVSQNTIWHYHANIHKALQYAVKTERIKTNPSDNVELPKKKKECGFENVRLHDLRHTAATVLARELTPKQVQAFLGHEDFQTTMNIYTHIETQDKINTSCTMDSIIKKAEFCSESCSES